MGEELTVRIDDNNEHDQYAVDVVKDDVVVGHVPQEVTRVSYYFIRHGGQMKCQITGRRKLGKGLVVPCIYCYSGPSRILKKLKTLHA